MSYQETYPAACESGVTCKVCTEEVAVITFEEDGTKTGVCRCRWTSWLFYEDGKVVRSTPRAFEA